MQNQTARGLLLLAILLASIVPGLAGATCQRWDVNGAWTFVQSNDTTPTLELQQAGDRVQGSATYRETRKNGWFWDYKGSIDGTVNGDRMQLTVYWDQGAIGIYNAKINPDGSLEGGTYDKRDPDNYATWNADRKARCELSSERPVGADGRPTMVLGRVKVLPAGGQCPRWNLAGVSKMTQSGTLVWVSLKLAQSGSTFSGDAKYTPPRGVQKQYIEGRVQGSVSGNEVDFTAAWADNTTGLYHGSIDPTGRVTGYTYQKENHGLSADWSMVDRATCDTSPGAENKGVGFGRIVPRDPSRPAPSICDAARSARARNSPAAPGLEAQCQRVGETTNVPISTLVDRSELDRLAEIGHAIARNDVSVASARRSSSDLQYRFGFDVASALFGDPSLGGQGNTALGPGSLNIRASLDPASQPGFDDSANFHFSRHYGP